MKTWDQLSDKEKAMAFNQHHMTVVGLLLIGYQLEGMTIDHSTRIQERVAAAVKAETPHLAGDYLRYDGELRIVIAALAENAAERGTYPD